MTYEVPRMHRLDFTRGTVEEIDPDTPPKDATYEMVVGTQHIDDFDDPPGRRAPGKGEAGLRFERLGGPLVVVCGLHGGAGVSTLAYALAKRAATESPGSVLLCETDGSRGDQAAFAGVSPLFALGHGGAQRGGEPRTCAARRADCDVPVKVSAARAFHVLTVVDAGSARASGAHELLSVASHVVWAMRAEPGAALRARAQLAMPALAARQALVVRGDRRESRELRRLAEACCDRLIYVSDSPGISGTKVDLGARRLLDALTGLAGFLHGEAS